MAEHHFRTLLTRFNVTRVVSVACISALALLPAIPAQAATPSDGIRGTAQAIDAAAQRWFAAENHAADIDARIADVEHRISVEQQRIALTHSAATQRAVTLYKNSGMGLTSIFGSTALDSARRAHLADDANAGGDAAIAQLGAALADLNAQKARLESERAAQQRALRAVASERTALDAQLAGLRAEAQRAARVALASAHDRATQLVADAHVRAIAFTATASPPSAAPVGPPQSNSVSAVVVAAPPTSGRVSAHHDDPFLVCTRARESSGEYNVVSSSGYYGAYQFLPSTWDSVAVHAGRNDLIGVLPSRASQFDQDEMAWALYQWQGKSPWGGRC